MAHAIYFDTLAYANKLKDSGVPAKQAEVQAEALAEIFEERVATKQDIDTLRSDMHTEINNLRTEMKVGFAEVKSEMIKWGLGISAAQAALILSALKFFH